MAYFKRRRGSGGPSKNEKKVMRSREEERQSRAGGTLAQRYPYVKRLVVHLEFLSPQKHPLSQETRAFEPADICKFSVSCPGRCGDGSFDLAGKIDAVILAEQTASESSGKCPKPLYAGAAETCGCELKCRLEVSYLPKPEPAPDEVPQA